MSNREDLLRAAREKRKKADQVRRLVQSISLNVDQVRMRQQVLQLEAEAEHLEQLAAASDPSLSSPSGPQVQQRVQQQQQEAEHEAEPRTNAPKDSGGKP